MTTAAEIAAVLERAKRQGNGGFVACCPAHDDREPSLSINDGDKGPVVKCHAGCPQDAVIDALEARGIEIRKPRTNVNGKVLHAETVPFSVELLAQAKHLDPKFLAECGVVDAQTAHGNIVGFSYWTADDAPAGIKYRRSLSGDRGFFWSQGARPSLYGLWRLEQMRALDQRIILCEGETDCLTLWQHEFCALGLPGANVWREEWLSLLPADAPVYVIIEPDKGGQAVLAWLAKSGLRHRAKLVRMTERAKDPSALYLSDPAAFIERFDGLLAAAVPAEIPAASKIRIRQAAEIVNHPIKAAWLLRPYLEQMVLALLYGELGSLKSFVTLDMLLSLSAGHVWGDSKFTIAPRPVVYISAEGKGLEKRLRAWATHHAIDLASIPFYAIEHAVDLSQAPNVDEMLAAISALKVEPAVVAVDTLSKNKGALDENQTADMSTFLNQLDAKIRQPLKCSVLLVHHVGHSAKDRSRGSYTLMSDTDANYLVERPDPKELVIKITTGRLKDSESPPPLFLKAKVVDLGTEDDDGEPETSLVLLPTEERPEPARKRPTGRRQLDILRMLEQQHKDGLKTWTITECRDWARSKLSIQKQSAHEAINSLILNGFLKQSIGGLELAFPPE